MYKKFAMFIKKTISVVSAAAIIFSSVCLPAYSEASINRIYENPYNAFININDQNYPFYYYQTKETLKIIDNSMYMPLHWIDDILSMFYPQNTYLFLSENIHILMLVFPMLPMISIILIPLLINHVTLVISAPATTLLAAKMNHSFGIKPLSVKMISYIYHCAVLSNTSAAR